MQGGRFRGVLQGLHLTKKPHHIGHTPQVHKPKHKTPTFQEEHLGDRAYGLLSHLQLQVGAYVCGTTLPSSTNQTLIVKYFLLSPCGSNNMSRASAQTCVLILYLVAHDFWQPCLF